MALHKLLALTVVVTLASCKTAGLGDPAVSTPTDADADSGPLTLPTLTDPDAFMEAATRAVRRGGVTGPKASLYAKRIAAYMAFLGVAPDSTNAKTLLNRLMSGSTQFLTCERSLDWQCLEATPELQPTAEFRRDVDPSIGEMLRVPGELDMEFFLTNQWDLPKDQVDKNALLAVQLGQKIKDDAKRGVWMALYGIDDIDGWMSPVYQALLGKIKAKVPVYGVFDTEGVREHTESLPLEYSLGPSDSSRWIFAQPQPGKPNIAFQYASTVELINEMNQRATTPEMASARIEWPDTGIMHNKFFILDNGQGKSVWTGTTNVSETCMGSERNANMAIYIKNDVIAQEFQNEFDEMYAFKPERYEDPELRDPQGGVGVPVGRFHKNKTANTRRYFRFDDGTDVHLHFAPTDDGEHRIIQPLLLNAKAGDEIRVAMFGGAGVELVRAFQLAVARGAHVKIIMDNLTGSNIHTWIKAKDVNLTMANPYKTEPLGSLEIRMDAWRGLNHHKTATVTRTYPNGKRAEVIIIGSQNWSRVGNDENDENMVTIMKHRANVPAAVAFNAHFDERLWPNSVPYEPNAAPSTGEIPPGADAAAD